MAGELEDWRIPRRIRSEETAFVLLEDGEGPADGGGVHAREALDSPGEDGVEVEAVEAED